MRPGGRKLQDALTWLEQRCRAEAPSLRSRIRKNINMLSLEGQNLLDEANTYSINGNPLLPQGYYRYGASYKLGLSYRF